jgi:hypothetical protein
MLGIAAIAAFFAVGLAVSARLLGLWWRTRRLPELMAALGLLGIGPLGFCVLIVGLTALHGTASGHRLYLAGLAIQALGFIAASVFTWRVFRPSFAWARALSTAISVGVLFSLAATAIESIPGGPMLWCHHLDVWIKIACLVWAAGEALHYWRVTRHRVSIGFADPLVCASILCWGVALSAAALGFLLVYASLLVLPPGATLGGGVQLALSLCGIVAAVSLYLAFLPPRSYAGWVEARTAGAARGS